MREKEIIYETTTRYHDETRNDEISPTGLDGSSI
jgi:hypothetical protein